MQLYVNFAARLMYCIIFFDIPFFHFTFLRIIFWNISEPTHQSHLEEQQQQLSPLSRLTIRYVYTIILLYAISTIRFGKNDHNLYMLEMENVKCSFCWLIMYYVTSTDCNGCCWSHWTCLEFPRIQNRNYKLQRLPSALEFSIVLLWKINRPPHHRYRTSVTV